LGYPQRATIKSKESLTVANEIKASPRDLVSALWWSAALNLQLRNSEGANQNAGAAARLADEHGMVVLLGTADLLRGWAIARMGRLDEGLSILTQCRSGLVPIVSPWFYVGLAEVCLAAGRLREGLEAVDEALGLTERTGTRVLEAETRRLKGELILLMRDVRETSQAERCFRDAIKVACKQSAKSFELRATMSLARLLDRQGRRNEARTILAEIYNWFTEGFDTADLIDAKALLDELNTKPVPSALS
jgi:predicted ATPase